MKQQRLKLYTINIKYVRNLSKVDDNVMSVSPQIEKKTRPFVGILILLGDKKYCVPLSSPKQKFEKKKNSVDFMRITHPTKKNEQGANKLIGVLNFNNMIPIEDSLLAPVDLTIHRGDDAKKAAYKSLMKDQLDFCQRNQDMILKRANKLYNLVTKYPDKNINLTKRCCNFIKLEQALSRYNEK